ncbi:(-)-delta-cadinene synthase [Actinomadura rubteroloni]|uniref:Terpene synthase n=1 Tax=Actinomadura rubteroloni TaxID=1926885 RepID=A0A2P4UGJ4_9ACTN|nr:terpene synthase family protein [Actinomadura rubteroloni]POM24192.1 (-)-delta-cadinene synthase [Actinomadura rubteroloni]
MINIVDVSSLLHSLGDRVTAPAGPVVPRADAHALAERLEDWTRARGLGAGVRPLARCERLAVRLFPAAPADRVELFARWTVWAFALDDLTDTDPVGRSANAVHSLYADLLGALRRGAARPGARPLEESLAELWRETGPQMSRTWRRRFVSHLEDHRTGCAQEAVDRRMGDLPTPRAYPKLRRRAAAPFLFDLIEPVLGVELPRPVLGTPCWTTLIEGTADVMAWCNDVASYPRETKDGDVHNLLTVLSAAYGLGPQEAGAAVADRIEARTEQVARAARGMPGTLDAVDCAPEDRAAVERVARVLREAPRAHLDWLGESGRYLDHLWADLSSVAL